MLFRGAPLRGGAAHRTGGRALRRLPLAQDFDGLDAIPEGGGLLKAQVLCGPLHLLLQLAGHQAHPALQELHREVHAAVVLLRRHLRPAEAVAPAHVVVQAGPLLPDIPWEGPAAGGQVEGPADYEEGQLTGREAELFAASVLEDEGEILSALLLQYYGERRVLPREICIPTAIEDQEVLGQLLTEKAGHKVVIRVPQRGERAQVLQMAADNAREEAERQTTSQERSDRTLELLAKLTGLPAPPERMESYDIMPISRPSGVTRARVRWRSSLTMPKMGMAAPKRDTTRWATFACCSPPSMSITSGRGMHLQPAEPREIRPGLHPGRHPRRGRGPTYRSPQALPEREGHQGGVPSGAGAGGSEIHRQGGV